MACCCIRIKQLCNVPVCGADAFIHTGINAPADGLYTLVLEFLGVEFKIRVNGIADQELIFPANELNENYTFTGKVLDPSGAALTIEEGEEPDIITYDCIGFKTMLSYVISEPEEVPPP